MTIPSIPSIFYEFSFNTDPNQNTIPPYWSDLSSRVQYGWTLTRGRQYELDVNEAGLWKVELANTDGALDPGNAGSPYAPNVLPYRPCRIRVVLGANLLTPDAASAGEYAPLSAGPVPPWLRVVPGAGNALVIGSVGAQAYQGTQVFVSTVPSGAGAPSDLLDVTVQQVNAGTTYTFSAQTQAVTSGQNPATYLAIGWIGANGATLSTTSGSPTTLTGGAGTWTQLAVTAQAPTGAVAALLRVVTTTTPSANSTVWTDGLQLEARGYATRWQMPWTPGTNMLPQTIATGSETMAAGDTVSSWWWPAAGSISQATNLTATPTGGATGVSWTLPSGSTTTYALYAGAAASTLSPVADTVQVTAGTTYTASAYLTRTGPDATVTASVEIAWFASTGALLSTRVGTAATVPTSGWVRATATGAAPAGAAWGRMYIGGFTPGTFTGTETIRTIGWQMEAAASVSTWADPGPATFLFTGLVERFPRTWSDLGATYGTSKLECVDATAALSQFPLPAPFVNEVLLLGPNFFYQLADAGGSAACADSAARRVPAPVENSPYGVGSLTLGSGITSNTLGSAFLGTSGPIATFNNNAGSSPSQLPETFISLHKTTAVPGPPNAGPWTRMIAFRASAIPPSGGGYTIWNSTSVNNLPGSCSFSISNTTGALFVSYHDGVGAHLSYIGGSSICDGNWHLVGMSVNPSSGAASVWLDGVQVSTGTGLSTPGYMPVDTIGAYVVPPLSIYQQGMVGDIAFATEFPVVLSSAQWSNLYGSWRSASSGESSGARYARVLSWIGWTGPTSIASGSTQSMGPATDTTGQTPLSALNLIAATENGDSYVSAAGVLTFTARSALYGARTPAVTFGENLPVGNAGEWPVEIGSMDFDPAHLANVTQVTQYQGSLYTGIDATSRRRYYSRQYQRTVNTSSGAEAQDAANYLLSQLKDPKQRANVIRSHPSAIVGLFPVVAQIDKNARMRLMKRPIGAPSTQLDGFVQRVSWTCTPASDFFVEHQASPADLVNYWRIAALHTTLSAQAASGQNQATINGLPDRLTNSLAQSMPSSQTLWFEPGTTRFEAVAVQTIPTTTPGYSTATLTLTGNFAFTHPAGSVVCEPLPTGVTDPTTWDASSLMAASYVPILSGGASGTNTVTVGALPDAAYNAFGQTWNTGDVIQLSPSGVLGIPESATIQSVSTTYPGYTQATITFTANLIHTHPVGDYVADIFALAGTDPTTFAPTTRVTYAWTLPVLLFLLGASGRLSKFSAGLAVPPAVVLLAVLGVGMTALAVRARCQGAASRPAFLGLFRIAGRAPGHSTRVSPTKLRIGMPTRAFRAARVALRKCAAYVLSVCRGLTVRRVAAPAVVADHVVEREALGDGCDLVFVEQPVHVPHPSAIPDFGPLLGGVSAPPAPTGLRLVDVCVDLKKGFHVPKPSGSGEHVFESDGI